MLYWQIGRQIVERQKVKGWGSRVIEQLSHDLADAFLGMQGLSARNLGYMKSFAQAFPDEVLVHQIELKLYE